ncbi:MAG: hypothetical protein LC655_02070, partial [Bacteroidales bacterium]|nr:hypothetical protein [Bacteroidales bacterium]
GSTTLRNSLFYQNSAHQSSVVYYDVSTSGGYDLYLYNCTLVENSTSGGGAHVIRFRRDPSKPSVFHIFNSIIYNNTVSTINIHTSNTDVIMSHNCHEHDLSAYGAGNITDPPLFVAAAANNYRLSPASPLCINTGLNQDGWMTNAFDLDGNPRIINTTVDRGCYEYPYYTMTVSPLAVTNFIFADNVVSNHAVEVGGSGLFPTNAYIDLTVMDGATNWMSLSSTHEVLPPNATNTVDLIHSATLAGPGLHTGVVRVVTTNTGLQHYDTTWSNEVAVTLQVNSLAVSALGVTNSTASGIDADDRHFDIISAGAGTYSYAIMTNSPVNWLQLSQESGVMTNAMTQSITLTYTNSGLLSSGVYTNLLRVVSTAGGGVTQDVAIVLNVDPLRTIPAVVTQQGLQGLNALSQDLKIYNAGVGSYHYSLTPTVSWLNILPNSGAVTHPLTNSHTLNY